MSGSTLKELLSNEKLRSLAGSRSYGAGKTYYEDDLVISLVEDGEQISAVVQGSEAYQVHLKVRNGRLDYDCSCPFAEEGAFCKHCVAAGLAWLEEAKTPSKGKASVTMKDIREYLLQQDKAILAEMIVDLATRDMDLQNQLFLRVAKSQPDGPDLGTFRKTIEKAIKVHGYIEYKDVRNYAAGLDSIVNSLQELLDEGHANDVIELAEYSIELIEEAMRSLDDSNGSVGGVLAEVEELHLQACQVSPPEPETLAKHLYHLETTSEFAFGGAVNSYAEILGKTGLAAYRKLIQKDWDALPTLGPGDNDPEKYGRRYQLTHMMEAIVRQSGDIEELVEIKKRDLSNVYDFLAIATIYRDAGREHDALEWAERGKAAFPGMVDGRLADLLVSLYHDRGEHDKALDILWNRFQKSSYLQSYQTLKEYTEPLGQWPEWSKKALALVRTGIKERRKSNTQSSWGPPPDSSALVEILLWDGEKEEAWGEAQEGGCSEDLWLKLAAIRAAAHPNDALDIYKKTMIRVVERTTGDYSTPIDLLKKMQSIFKREKRMDEFQAEIEQLRIMYKRKINFIKALKVF